MRRVHIQVIFHTSCLINYRLFAFFVTTIFCLFVSFLVLFYPQKILKFKFNFSYLFYLVLEDTFSHKSHLHEHHKHYTPLDHRNCNLSFTWINFILKLTSFLEYFQWSFLLLTKTDKDLIKHPLSTRC